MAQIQDFGKKIGGAKKDLWKKRGLLIEDIFDWTDIERENLIKKDNVWTKPDYQAMVESGLSKRVVYFIKLIRDSLPSKPSINNEEYQNGYISFISELRDKTMSIKSEQEVLDYFERIIKNYVYKEGYSYHPKPETYGYLTNKLFKAAQVKNFFYIDRDIKRKQFLYTTEEKILSNYDFFRYDVKNVNWETDHAGTTRMVLSLSEGIYFFYPENDDKIKENWKDGTYFIRNAKIVGKNFETLDKAKEYVLSISNIEKKQDNTINRKKKFIPIQLLNLDRVGDTYKNIDVSGDDMLKVFGFYGGEFGNWLNDKDRQANLNFCYDAFADLSRALNISNKDISLNGELAIAFGARGRAGAAAHYEPERRVINLTKMSGAGSLAHEWGHALDHYLGRNFRNKDGFLTETYNELIYHLLETMRYKINEDGRRVKTDFYSNSIEFDKIYAKDSKGYWQSSTEMFARAFACYVFDKLKENNEKNDYLCGHAQSCISAMFDNNGNSTFIKAYPEGLERLKIDECFDDLLEKVRGKGLINEYQKEPFLLSKMMIEYNVPITMETVKKNIKETFKDFNEKNENNEIVFLFDGTKIGERSQSFNDGYVIINARTKDEAVETFKAQYGRGKHNEALCAEVVSDFNRVGQIKRSNLPCHNYIDLTKPQEPNQSNTEEQTDGRK